MTPTTTSQSDQSYSHCIPKSIRIRLSFSEMQSNQMRWSYAPSRKPTFGQPGSYNIRSIDEAWYGLPNTRRTIREVVWLLCSTVGDGALAVFCGSRPSSTDWQAIGPHDLVQTFTDIKYLARWSLRMRETVGRRAACISLSEPSGQHFTSTRRPTTASRARPLRTRTIDANLLELRGWHHGRARYNLYGLDGIGMRSEIQGLRSRSTNTRITSTSGLVSQGKWSRRRRMKRKRCRCESGNEGRIKEKG